MADEKTPEELAAEEAAKKKAGGNKNSTDGDGDAPPTPEELKAAKDANVDLEKKLKAQDNQNFANTRKLEDKIKALEAEKTPPEDQQRIANLEVELARSKAVSQHGLSTEDAAMLRGTPAEILSDAEHWATRLKDKKPDKDPDPNEEPDPDPNKKPDEDPNKKPDKPKPKPKPGDEGSWMDRYKAGTAAERYKMDQDVKNGLVDPTT